MQVLLLRALTKTFFNIRAVDQVTMDFHAGEIHALLGENGAGKSTLMHLVSGLYQPDSGEIRLDGQRQVFSSARTALAAGIAMVHQHFMLIPSLTVAENVALALTGRIYERIKTTEIAQRVAELAAEYGIVIEDFHAQVEALPVGTQQRVEILKALATKARVLILDEPTAVLTPHEVENLFSTLDKLKQQGYVIILITHKIPEVLAVSDRLSILRKGRLVATRETRSCSTTILGNLMVEDEKSLSPVPRGNVPSSLQSSQAPVSVSPLLEIKGVSIETTQKRLALRKISFTLKQGEILGFVGVDGNGQAELAELLIGLRSPREGEFFLKGRQILNTNPAELRAAGIAIIPQDRRREGLAPDLSIAENFLLNLPLLSRLADGVFLPPAAIRSFAEKRMQQFSILPAAPERQAASLSGGNQQRIVLARELATAPQIIIAVNPSRGLDIKATQYVHQQLRERQTAGAGIILISTDLDEVFSLSDRIYVLYQGQLLGPVVPTTSREIVGQMMGGGA